MLQPPSQDLDQFLAGQGYAHKYLIIDDLLFAFSF